MRTICRKDTVLIVNTDHGFLLGEHEWLGKNFPPPYDELVHLPFYFHVPGIAEGGRCEQLATTVDIAPTLLELFGCAQTPMGEMDGRSLLPALEGNRFGNGHCLVSMAAIRALQMVG